MEPKSAELRVLEVLDALERGPAEAEAGAIAAGLGPAAAEVAEIRPLLPRIATLLGHEHAAVRQAVLSALLAALDRWRGNKELFGAVLDEIQSRNPGRPAVVEFVTTAREAHRTILEEAYRRMIRSLTRSYESDGTVPKCPKCASTQVSRGEGFFEFTEMICGACGYKDLADDYGLEAWYPE